MTLESNLLSIDPRTVREVQIKKNSDSPETLPAIIAGDRDGNIYMQKRISVKSTIELFSSSGELHPEGTLREQAESVANYMSKEFDETIVVGVSLMKGNDNSLYYNLNDLALWKQINQDDVVYKN